MDAVDFAIFRSLCGEGGARFYAARTVIDPRISAADVAERIGISATAVRARLRRWHTEGLLRGHAVWPNPALFGVGMMSVDIPLEMNRPADGLFLALKSIEGVWFARDAIDEDRRVVIVNFVSDTPSSTQRRIQALTRLAPGNVLDPPRPAWLPICTVELSRLDWKIVRIFRADPLVPLPRAAKEVGVTLKTLSRRYHRLLDGDAVWWTISVSNSKVPAVYVHVMFRDAELAERGNRELGEKFPNWIPAATGGYGFPPEARPVHLVAVFPLESPAGVADILRAIHALPGVVAVRRRFPGESVCYPEWFDRRIEEKIAESPTDVSSSARENVALRPRVRAAESPAR